MLFNPEKSLFELYAVRWIAGSFALLACITAILIAINTDSSIALDGESFNRAINLFKAPLGTIAVGLTLIGICGANHRSEQTKRQIERTSRQIAMTQSQNDFSNYYKHIEVFTEYCEIHTTQGYRPSRPRKLHSRLFPQARNGDFAIDKKFLSYFEQQIQMFVNICDGFKFVVNQEFAALALTRLESAIEAELNLTRTETRGGKVVHAGDTQFMLSGDSLLGIIKTYSTIFFAIDEVLRFDLDYQPPALLEMMQQMDYSDLPASSFSDSHTVDIKEILARSAEKNLILNPLSWQ
jgi:hypothetical protein